MAKKIELKGPIMDNDTAWIYHWLGWDATCPKDLARALREANGEDIILEVNSPGGYCDYTYDMCSVSHDDYLLCGGQEINI